MAACTRFRPESGPWRRCFCGKNFLYLLFQFYPECILPRNSIRSLQVLDGQRVLPVKAKELGFTFKYSSVKDALRSIISQ